MAERELRISTPVVLAAASAMIAVAVVVWASTREEDPPPAPPRPRDETLVVDDTSPERVAISFYDAWRRRRWTEALAVSTGNARESVLLKQARDARLPADERVVVERMWDALARAPLELVLDEAEMPPGDRVVLRGTAQYEFVNRPYRRRVELVVVPAGRRFRVTEMQLGEVLTPLPEIFGGAGEEERP